PAAADNLNTVNKIPGSGDERGNDQAEPTVAQAPATLGRSPEAGNCFIEKRGEEEEWERPFGQHPCSESKPQGDAGACSLEGVRLPEEVDRQGRHRGEGKIEHEHVRIPDDQGEGRREE